MTGPIPPAERLADDIDRAQQAADIGVARGIEAARIAAAAPAPAWKPGVCRNCAEQPIAGVFCDQACRLDYDRRARRG